VNRIIADHGGAISLQNRPDGLQGARVRITLPENGALAMQAGELNQDEHALEAGRVPSPLSL
jgi:two-component system nitrogen regulation sensor histidine kinase NtrY